ncbi:MAG: patatin-like phospholipase family protein [Saprospiraceae bacterium]|nr:patatin-like phospholipase family protein [Saprospiraceae bacterium]
MSKSKKLKVCLAMGGGVSLGSYSGAALTEALKLLVLYGQDKDGTQYESVEVDGMSGASAGSIALAIMMRCLIDYKSLLSIQKIKDSVNDSVSQIEKNLNLKSQIVIGGEDEMVNKLEWIVTNTYPIPNGFSNEKMTKLVALELTQIVQKSFGLMY